MSRAKAQDRIDQQWNFERQGSEFRLQAAPPQAAPSSKPTLESKAA